MKENINKVREQCAIHCVECCAECEEQKLIEEMQREQYLHDLEMQREQYLHDLQWQENMNSLYTWDEGGFCDGFTKC